MSQIGTGVVLISSSCRLVSWYLLLIIAQLFFPEAVPRIEKSIKTVADCGSQRKPPESLQRQESTDGVEANGSISTRAAA